MGNRFKTQCQHLEFISFPQQVSQYDKISGAADISLIRILVILANHASNLKPHVRT